MPKTPVQRKVKATRKASTSRQIHCAVDHLNDLVKEAEERGLDVEFKTNPALFGPRLLVSLSETTTYPL